MNTASRLKHISEYYFSSKMREIAQMNDAGRQVINLGIGSPDLPPHPDVIQKLQEVAALPGAHAYQSYKGIPALRAAMADFYRSHYKVSLDPETEILPLAGSKEGIMHICMTFLEEGDEALVPDPGYPTYSAAVKLSGAKPVTYAIIDGGPDLALLDSQDLSRVKLMFINYPHMPTGQLAGTALFRKLVEFAQKHDILLVHDNPYSFILNDDPQSILAIEGASDVAIELNSLSKSHNMAGWRIGMLSGNAHHVQSVLTFRSNMDSGMFLALQEAAVTALSLGKDWFDHINHIYAVRKKAVLSLLKTLPVTVPADQAGLFVWAECAEPGVDGFQLSDRILHEANVFITPGGIFGDQGQNYIRVSLCATPLKINEARERIMTMKINQQPQT